MGAAMSTSNAVAAGAYMGPTGYAAAAAAGALAAGGAVAVLVAFTLPTLTNHSHPPADRRALQKAPR